MKKYLVVLMVICITGIFAQASNGSVVSDSTATNKKPVLYYAADQSILVMPTAYTMEKGTWAFTDYELVGLQLSGAITNSTHFTTAMLFPISSELVKTFTLGFKQNYFKTSMVQSALWASYILNPHLLSVGNVVSIGTPKSSVHLAAAWGTDFEDYSNTYAVMVGVMHDLSPRVAVLGEFLSTSKVVEDEGNGLVNFGLRFKGRDLSWDIGGIRPLRDGGSDLFAYPFVKATIVF